MAMTMDYSSIDIMTVQEMIESAIVFNDKIPVVDFKLLQTILCILAKNTNTLERLVSYNLPTARIKRTTTVNITAIKVHTRKKKHKSLSKKATTDHSSGRAESGAEESTGSSESRAEESAGRSESGAEESTGRSESRAKESKSRSRSRAEESKSRSRSRSKTTKKRDTNYSTYQITEKARKGGQKFKTKATDKEEEEEEGDIVMREKLLVVSTTDFGTDTDEFHRGSIVTEEQFQDLLKEVRKLQAKYGIPDMFAESETPWINLHGATSLTDPKAALNISARLNAVEAKATAMLDVIKKFAHTLPGINIDGFLGEPGQSSEEIMKKDDADIQEEKTIMAQDLLTLETEVQTEPERDEKRVTWNQLMDKLNAIRDEVIPDMSKKATAPSERAKNAINIFKKAEPVLKEAQNLDVKLANLLFMSKSFCADVGVLEKNIALQMGDYEESIQQLQFDLDVTLLDRIDAVLAHPKEDPHAVAAISADFTNFQHILVDTKQRQLELNNRFKNNLTSLDVLRKKIEELHIHKTTRDAVADALKHKVSLYDVNGLLTRGHFFAVTESIQSAIQTMTDRINNVEYDWQKCIDNYKTELYDRANLNQLVTFKDSLNKYTTTMNISVDEMLDIVGPYPVTGFKKKLDRDGKDCLACGAAANVKLSDAYMKVAKELMTRPVTKPPMMEEIQTQKPCIPGRPIPHLLDPRGFVYDRSCGVSICKSDKSLPSLFGLDVVDINPVQTSNRHSQVHLIDLSIRCACNRSKETI